jgi:hypothetical protein
MPGIVINVFEAVDVITLIKGGIYDDLNSTVGDALLKRSDVRHPHTPPHSNRLTSSLGIPRYLHLLATRPTSYNLRHDPQISRP